jgi:protein-tyrosine phosphatase
VCPEVLILVDIHCHIIAGVDDGAKSWEVAAQMCRMAAADGIEHIVATPHANDRYAYNRDEHSRSLDHLRSLIGGKPRLSLGCDFHLSYENVQDALTRPDWYTIEGGKYMLVELSNYGIPHQIEEYFSKLGDKGIRAIVTHPERNPILQQDRQRILRWVEQGCIVQVTGSVLTGSWGEKAWRTAAWLFEHQAVHVLATDAHDTKNRIPVLSTARKEVEEVYGRELADALVDKNPQAIVNGQPLPYFPNPVSN